METLPLSLRLLREIHAVLLDGVRGSQKSPGEFRSTQNWIGVGPRGLRDATFIPPPPGELMTCLGDFEGFLYKPGPLHPLMVCALAHAQFETIHPFLDGNGRMGRLLITLLLCRERILLRPLLYLSHYLKVHRSEYYDRLMAVRVVGDWEGWLRFFLTGVLQVAIESERTARRIVELREETRRQVHEAGLSARSLALLDHLFEQPVVNVAAVQAQLQVSYVSANSLVTGLCEIGLMDEITGGRRNRMFRFTSYVDLFADPGTGSDALAVESNTEREAASHP
ncbi:Fic family protein [Acrocarpospora catenulata]|uniref:Fic family protein n=1 Tax=Acrocarpospora catenulata TaxID=2836182 RepID=UPI0021122776|nr:Fic family protein [Acrocarpospora catenulata]